MHQTRFGNRKGDFRIDTRGLLILRQPRSLFLDRVLQDSKIRTVPDHAFHGCAARSLNIRAHSVCLLCVYVFEAGVICFMTFTEASKVGTIQHSLIKSGLASCEE